MQDRIPTHAGRVKLTPVAGTTDKFDLEMADEPTVEGTPLNKANLLSDTTAQKFVDAGIVPTAPTTPNEAFDSIAEYIPDLETKLDSFCKKALVTWDGTGQTTKTITFGFKPLFFVVWDVSVAYASIFYQSGSSAYGLSSPTSAFIMPRTDLVSTGLYYAASGNNGSVTAINDTSVTLGGSGSLGAKFVYNASGSSYAAIAFG